MLAMIIANLFGVITIAFLIWYKLKDDYHYERIFNLTSSILLGLMVSSILSKYFFAKDPERTTGYSFRDIFLKGMNPEPGKIIEYGKSDATMKSLGDRTTLLRSNPEPRRLG